MNTRFTALAVILCSIAFHSTTDAEDWLQWRGPSRSDRSPETGLLKSWPEAGPKQLWVNDKAGFGYSGFSIQGDKLYTLGLEGDSCFGLCLNADTGKEIWRNKIGEKFENRWGDGPRSTPTIDGKNIYILTAGGTLACVNAANGKKVWSRQMSEFGGKVPFWGYSESPLVDGKLVLCTPGGDEGSIVALNKSNGKLVWQTNCSQQSRIRFSIGSTNSLNGPKTTSVQVLKTGTGCSRWSKKRNFPTVVTWPFWMPKPENSCVILKSKRILKSETNSGISA